MLRPSFEKGSILKKNMLESLRDYPRKAFDLLFSDYKDGIIEGFSIDVKENGSLSVSPGVVKLGEGLYFSDTEQIIEQREEHNYVYVEVESNSTADGDVIEVRINQYSSPQNEKMELFRYTKNAELLMFQDCKDLFNPPINRINKLYSKYSYRCGSSLCPEYFKLYANEVLNSNNAKMIDIAFALECLNGLQDIDLIKAYFKNDGTNNSVIEAMQKKLVDMNSNTENTQIEQKKSQGPRKMMVS